MRGRHAVEKVTVKRASMIIHAIAMVDILEKIAKQVSDSYLVDASMYQL